MKKHNLFMFLALMMVCILLYACEAKQGDFSETSASEEGSSVAVVEEPPVLVGESSAEVEEEQSYLAEESKEGLNQVFIAPDNSDFEQLVQQLRDIYIFPWNNTKLNYGTATAEDVISSFLEGGWDYIYDYYFGRENIAVM